MPDVFLYAESSVPGMLSLEVNKWVYFIYLYNARSHNVPLEHFLHESYDFCTAKWNFITSFPYTHKLQVQWIALRDVPKFRDES